MNNFKICLRKFYKKLKKKCLTVKSTFQIYLKKKKKSKNFFDRN